MTRAPVTPAKRTALEWVDDHRNWLSRTTKEIWDFHEPAWREYRSAAYYVRLLRELGFEVEEGTAGMPTAFRATLRERPARDRERTPSTTPCRATARRPCPYREAARRASTSRRPATPIRTPRSARARSAGCWPRRPPMERHGLARHARLLRRAGREGLRLEAGPCRARLLRRPRRRDQLPPRLGALAREHRATGTRTAARTGARSTRSSAPSPRPGRAPAVRSGRTRTHPPARRARSTPCRLMYTALEDAEGGHAPPHRHVDGERGDPRRRAGDGRQRAAALRARSSTRAARRRSRCRSGSSPSSTATPSTPPR